MRRAVRTGFYLLAAAAFVSSLSLLVLRYRTLEAEEREWSVGQPLEGREETARSEQADAERDANSAAEIAAADGLKGVRTSGFFPMTYQRNTDSATLARFSPVPVDGTPTENPSIANPRSTQVSVVPTRHSLV